MAHLQNLRDARLQEVVAIRSCEDDTSGDVLLYVPRSHKTAHLDRGKVVVPWSQEILSPRAAASR